MKRDQEGRTEAKLQADELCTELRKRGDDLSLNAACEIEGTLDCFEKIADENAVLRDRVARLEWNHDSLNRLWSRVPVEARMKAAHGGTP